MNHLLTESLEQNEVDRLEIKETQRKKWRIFLYILIVIKITLCIVVLSLDSYLAINGLGSTKKYLGFCQVKFLRTFQIINPALKDYHWHYHCNHLNSFHIFLFQNPPSGIYRQVLVLTSQSL